MKDRVLTSGSVFSRRAERISLATAFVLKIPPDYPNAEQGTEKISWILCLELLQTRPSVCCGLFVSLSLFPLWTLLIESSIIEDSLFFGRLLEIAPESLHMTQTPLHMGFQGHTLDPKSGWARKLPGFLSHHPDASAPALLAFSLTVRMSPALVCNDPQTSEDPWKSTFAALSCFLGLEEFSNRVLFFLTA